MAMPKIDRREATAQVNDQLRAARADLSDFRRIGFRDRDMLIITAYPAVMVAVDRLKREASDGE